MIINFECKTCHGEFDSDVGAITFTPDPEFEALPNCPRCGQRDKNGVWLTEMGQSQMTEAFLKE